MEPNTNSESGNGPAFVVKLERLSPIMSIYIGGRDDLVMEGHMEVRGRVTIGEEDKYGRNQECAIIDGYGYYDCTEDGGDLPIYGKYIAFFSDASERRML